MGEYGIGLYFVEHGPGPQKDGAKRKEQSGCQEMEDEEKGFLCRSSEGFILIIIALSIHLPIQVSICGISTESGLVGEGPKDPPGTNTSLGVR